MKKKMATPAGMVCNATTPTGASQGYIGITKIKSARLSLGDSIIIIGVFIYIYMYLCTYVYIYIW